MISLSSGSQLNSRVHGELLCLQLFVSFVYYLYFSTSFIPLPFCYASKQGLLTTGFDYQQNKSVQSKGRNPEISSFHFLFQLSNKVTTLSSQIIRYTLPYWFRAPFALIFHGIDSERCWKHFSEI